MRVHFLLLTYYNVGCLEVSQSLNHFSTVDCTRAQRTHCKYDYKCIINTEYGQYGTVCCTAYSQLHSVPCGPYGSRCEMRMTNVH